MEEREIGSSSSSLCGFGCVLDIASQLSGGPPITPLDILTNNALLKIHKLDCQIQNV